MTAGEVIAQVDELRPNAYSTQRKLRWLRRLDGQILAEIWETHGAPCPCHCEASAHTGRGNGPGHPLFGLRPNSPCPLSNTGDEGTDCHTSDVGHWFAMTEEAPPALPSAYDADTELLAPFPWGEGVYTAWLFCQIDLHNGEIQKYNQSLALLASAWRSLADWVNRRRMPLASARTWRM